MSPHDDLEEEFAALFRQLFHAHVIEDQQVRFEVTIEDSVMTFEGFVVQEVTNTIEDASVVNREPVTDQLAADALNEMAFANSGRPDEDRVVVFAHEVTGGHVEDLFSFDRRIELEVEIVEAFLITEGRSLGASGDLAIIANDQFIGKDQFQELGMVELGAFGFLKTDFERVG